MQRKSLKRLPVVDEAGRLISMVSRSDLLRVYLRQDRAIREEIRADVLSRTLGIAPDSLDVQMVERQVTLAGRVERRSLLLVLEQLCAGVDGVIAVTNRLDYR